MRLTRRTMILAAAATAAAPAALNAQAFPSRSIRIVVPYAPGGGADTVARLLAPKLQDALGQAVVIDNKPGAGGVIGDDTVAKAPPDGHTLLLGAFAHAVNPSLLPRMPFRTPDDFAPVSLLVVVPDLLVVTPSLPAQSVADLIALAKAQPGKLSYGSAGNGTAQHLAAELFKARTGADIQHVPYKGGGPALVDVAAGHVQMLFGNMSSALPQAQAGRVRAMAVTSPKRSPAAPDVPTIAESGVPGYDMYEWNALLAPAGTPAAVIARLQQEAAKALRLPDVVARLATLGAEPVGSTPEAFAAFLRTELAKWADIVKTAGIKVE
ncbi:MAG TPA: tripartite tricarboxylate transporter substrate binding protein [Vineibacter sp.]|nr:tripartite tricarboxylate transporter substrate binding protein [Vineibacter sp.]